jgi:hypothetical protein
MSQAGDLFRELQERQMEAMRQYQDTVAETMRAWQGLIPSVPGMPGSSGSSDSPSGTPSMGDLAAMFPNPVEIADNYFRFAEEMLARQHEFSLRLIEAVAPQTGGNRSSGS